ncbi:small proline-rich protein 4 isoform X2 [Hippopotamus amphibius kiboko]|uniref:small proline-rich protein 4 isoform X2 n=1 Tax=Hippopotamus amphibius kiboko TaxID=575201 RepID=UPI002595D30D|nr:small proline-rich protein 4 isoform X2 [Hippopotamus amphibius kiboko]
MDVLVTHPTPNHSQSSTSTVMSSQQQQQQCPPQMAQQQQVKQPCQPPPVKCQETCAPKTKDPCAFQGKKQCPPKNTAIQAQQMCPSAQQAPKSKQK